ncbi:MAG: response regulator [Deltaproteobacteria bacterium]|nr:response regulator [Deltaproteobacteria bacterium]MBW2417715.1 response regulator [Deltaproteobacteria bacterium]
MVPSGPLDEWILRAPPPSEDPGLVLVVDDEAPVLLALRRILDGDRHVVVLASSPDEASGALEDPGLDVVLVDLAMGEASGLELLERVKRERPEVQVIVMTGNASIDSAVECMRRGAFDYLSKPFENLRRVRDTVRRAVERSREAARGMGQFGDAEAASPARSTANPATNPAANPATREAADASAELPLSLEAYEKVALERALWESAGDAGAAARRLGIGRSTFYRKLAKHGIGDGRGEAEPERLGGAGVGSYPPIR